MRLRSMAFLAGSLVSLLALVGCIGQQPAGATDTSSALKSVPSGPAASNGGTSARGSSRAKSMSPTETSALDARTADAGTPEGAAPPNAAPSSADASSPAPSSSVDGSAASAAGAPSPHTGPWRVMAFGDSITAASCWRAKLGEKLAAAHITNVDFIGTRSGPAGCGVASYDMQNEGHGGYLATDILDAAGSGTRSVGADAADPFKADARDLASWFDGEAPDVMLWHLGTNDVWSGIDETKILQAYSAILAKVRSRNPNVVVLVAQLIPMAPKGCDRCAAGVTKLNAAIPAWAKQSSTATSPVTVVDQFTGYDVKLNADGVHPNETGGSQAIADKWFTALAPLLR